MKTVMFFSYKGGSGRTVAAANVSAALAKLGKRVAVIDLDFEAPGLQHVFRVERTPQFSSGRGIQHYLKGEVDLNWLMSKVAIDVFSREGPLSFYPQPEGRLLYIMASTKVAQVDHRDPHVTQRMRSLIDVLSKEFDYLLIDAASGLRDTFSMAADISDEMLVFFRWSMQHVEGTLRTARYIKLLTEYQSRTIPFRVVASATPGDSELASLKDSDLRDRLCELKDANRAKIEAVLQECDAPEPTIFHEIPEMVALKWREDVVVFSGDTASVYEILGRKLLDNDGK